MVDHPPQVLFGIFLPVGLLLELFVELRNTLEYHREIQLFLVGEVGIDRSLADTGLMGDIVHQHFVEALGGEEAGRLLDHLFPAFFFSHDMRLSI